MKKRSMIVFSLLLAWIAVFQSGRDQERFSGGRVKNPASQREARPGTDLPQKKATPGCLAFAAGHGIIALR